MIRVLVVDDHAVVRSGLRRLLDAEPDIETVGEAPNADRAVFEAIETRPDVVLMDLVMPEKGGIEGMPAVLQAVPEARVLVLSMQDDPRYVRAAFEAGASGYVLKEAADTEVVSAIRAVAAGERYVNPALGARLITYKSGDRRAAVHLRPHGGDAPGAHHAEAEPLEPCRPRSLRHLGGAAPARLATDFVVRTAANAAIQRAAEAALCVLREAEPLCDPGASRRHPRINSSPVGPQATRPVARSRPEARGRRPRRPGSPVRNR